MFAWSFIKVLIQLSSLKTFTDVLKNDLQTELKKNKTIEN